MISQHLERIREGANKVFNLHNLSNWVEKYLYLEGAKHAFKDKFYFQRAIIDDPSPEINVIKVAQCGLTTTQIAWSLAAVCSQRKFNIA